MKIAVLLVSIGTALKHSFENAEQWVEKEISHLKYEHSAEDEINTDPDTEAAVHSVLLKAAQSQPSPEDHDGLVPSDETLALTAEQKRQEMAAGSNPV